MPLDKLNPALVNDVQALEQQGRAKAPERVISGYVPPRRRARPALHAARQRWRVPADELEQLPVALAITRRSSKPPTTRHTRSAPGPAR